MAMSQSERMNYILQESKKYIARNKCRDSSEYTNIVGAKASKTSVPSIVNIVADPHTLQIVPPYQGQSDCAANVVVTGVGVNNTYTGILRAAEGCAVCADPDPSVNPYITLPTPCYDRQSFPFIQKDLSTSIIYHDSGFNAFPRREAICYSNTNMYVYPSAN